MNRIEDLTLRTAVIDDVDAIADLFLICWRTAYRGVLPESVVAMYDHGSARDLWQRSFAPSPTRREVIVAERPEQPIAGVIATGRDGDEARVGHIFSLYVHPDAQGLGVGTRAVAAAVERFRRDGLAKASLWVFEANSGARAFYERLGWLPDGRVRVEPEYGEPEVRLARSL